MVLEMVPAALAGEITRLLKVCATIGIGAGKDCDGQVLVLHDMLGLYPGKKGRFVRDFMAEAQASKAPSRPMSPPSRTAVIPAPSTATDAMPPGSPHDETSPYRRGLQIGPPSTAGLASGRANCSAFPASPPSRRGFS
jgi:hypothetical protein